jgi:hypothetical protein
MFSLDLEFKQKRVSTYAYAQSDTVRDRAPRSINDTNIDQFSKFLMQQSHIKASAKLIEVLKDQQK